MPTISQYALGIVLILHGIVHVWYVVVSQGWVEYEEAMGWNGRSWLLSGVLGEGVLLDIASVLYVVVAVGFVVGGMGYLLSRSWWIPVLIGSAILSTIVIVAMWDGRPTQLVEKGAVGVLINAGVLLWLVVLN